MDIEPALWDAVQKAYPQIDWGTKSNGNYFENFTKLTTTNKSLQYIKKTMGISTFKGRPYTFDLYTYQSYTNSFVTELTHKRNHKPDTGKSGMKMIGAILVLYMKISRFICAIFRLKQRYQKRAKLLI